MGCLGYGYGFSYRDCWRLQTRGECGERSVKGVDVEAESESVPIKLVLDARHESMIIAMMINMIIIMIIMIVFVVAIFEVALRTI